MLSALAKRTIAAPTARKVLKNPGGLLTRAMASTASLTVVPEGDLHISQPTWWLESRFHFSFADWYDPSREQFGVLRVVNDDLVKGQSGFGAHPHRDMEIFTYVVDGEVTHADSIGNKEALGRGCVQYMSAGTGIRHSEMNEGVTTTRFMQCWIMPDKRGHKPAYGSRVYKKEDRHNKFLQILGGTGLSWPAQEEAADAKDACFRMNQDANVVVAECDPGQALEAMLGSGRQAYLVCIEGSMDVNGTPLKARDAAKIVAQGGRSPLSLKAGDQGMHLLLIEMSQQSS